MRAHILTAGVTRHQLVLHFHLDRLARCPVDKGRRHAPCPTTAVRGVVLRRRRWALGTFFPALRLLAPGSLSHASALAVVEDDPPLLQGEGKSSQGVADAVPPRSAWRRVLRDTKKPGGTRTIDAILACDESQGGRGWQTAVWYQFVLGTGWIFCRIAEAFVYYTDKRAQNRKIYKRFDTFPPPTAWMAGGFWMDSDFSVKKASKIHWKKITLYGYCRKEML